MEKPKILIAPRTGSSSGLEALVVSRGHANAIHEAGGYSFSPNLPQPDFDETSYKQFLREMYNRASGVLIIGGTDCDPARYGEERREGTDEPVRERDFTDFTLIKWATNDNKPLLAVCAGSQRFNVYHDGTLYQNIFEQREGTEINHNDRENKTGIVHSVKVVNDHDVVQQIYGMRTEFGVNSTHKQAVKKLGEGLDIVLKSEDGVIEGTMRPDLPFAVALQYHPEAMWQVSGQELHLNVYKTFVEHAKQFKELGK